jgi:hypothetical protein
MVSHAPAAAKKSKAQEAAVLQASKVSLYVRNAEAKGLNTRSTAAKESFSVVNPAEPNGKQEPSRHGTYTLRL